MVVRIQGCLGCTGFMSLVMMRAEGARDMG